LQLFLSFSTPCLYWIFTVTVTDCEIPAAVAVNVTSCDPVGVFPVPPPLLELAPLHPLNVTAVASANTASSVSDTLRIAFRRRVNASASKPKGPNNASNALLLQLCIGFGSALLKVAATLMVPVTVAAVVPLIVALVGFTVHVT